MPDVRPWLAEVEELKSRAPACEAEELAPGGTQESLDKGPRSGASENTSVPASTSTSEADPLTSSSESWILNSRSGKAREARH